MKKKNRSVFFRGICLLVLAVVFLTGCGRKAPENAAEVMEGMYDAEPVSLGGQEGDADTLSPQGMTADGAYVYVLCGSGREVSDRITVISAEDGRQMNVMLSERVLGEICGFQKYEKTYQALVKQNGKLVLLEWDEKGEQKKRAELDFRGKQEDASLSVQRVAFAPEGTLYLSDICANLFYFSSDGMLERYWKTDFETYPDTMLLTGDGALFCTPYASAREKCLFWFDTKALAGTKNGSRLKAKKVPAKFSFVNTNTYLLPCTDGSYDFYVYEPRCLYGYTLGDNTMELVLDWVNSGIGGEGTIEGAAAAHDCFFVLFQEGYEETSPVVLYRLSKMTKEVYESREILTMGTVDGFGMGAQVLEYNRTQDKVRILVKDYSNLEEPVQALHQDLISGNAPDILDLDGLNPETYIKNGVLAELTEWIKKDPELSEEDFLENIVEAAKIDGKLYYLPPGFVFSVWVGRHDTIQGRKTWTLQEFMDLYRGRKKGTALFGMMAKEWVFPMLCNAMLPEFVNRETGDVDFQNEMFLDILKFSKEFEAEEMDYFERVDGFQHGTVLLEDAIFYDFSEYYHYKHLLGKPEFIGEPTEEGTGIYGKVPGLEPLLALTTQGKQELAYEFLKIFWSYDYQKKKMAYEIPTRKDVFDRKMEYAMAEKAYTDKDGDLVQPVSGTMGYNGVETRMTPLTAEEEAEIRRLVASVERLQLSDSAEEEIVEIAEEEAEAYFQGDKSAEEAAEIIQGRVELYISEKR